MTKAFEGIRRGLLDAIAFAQGDTTRGRVVRGSEVKPRIAKTKASEAKMDDPTGRQANLD